MSGTTIHAFAFIALKPIVLCSVGTAEWFVKSNNRQLEQLLNAELAMVVTPLPNVTSSKAVQWLNAPCPMVVTLFGIVNDVMLLKSKNALDSMLVTPDGIVTVETFAPHSSL